MPDFVLEFQRVLNQHIRQLDEHNYLFNEICRLQTELTTANNHVTELEYQNNNLVAQLQQRTNSAQTPDETSIYSSRHASVPIPTSHSTQQQ